MQPEPPLKKRLRLPAPTNKKNWLRLRSRLKSGGSRRLRLRNTGEFITFPPPPQESPADFLPDSDVMSNGQSLTCSSLLTSRQCQCAHPALAHCVTLPALTSTVVPPPAHLILTMHHAPRTMCDCSGERAVAVMQGVLLVMATGQAGCSKAGHSTIGP